MPHSSLTVVVLAAGAGTRMRSRTPKVLHGFAGRSMLGHVLAACGQLDATRTVVVVGHEREAVTEHVRALSPSATIAVQQPQHGTGHAVRVALESVDEADGRVLVVLGDAPLLTPASLQALLETHRSPGAGATLMTSVLPDPTGYGRVVRDDSGAVARIVEQRDATPDEQAITEVATYPYVFDETLLRRALTELTTDNAQGEEYLTDVVAILHGRGHVNGALVAPAEETAGVNDRVQLAAARRVYNDRLLRAHMLAGVTVVDPATTWVDAGVMLAPDVVLHPGTQLHGATRVDTAAEVGPDTTLTDTTVGAGSRVIRTVAVEAAIGEDATVGPFAYLRPGTVLAREAHVGTYVEIKNSTVGAGSKVPHLSYVGDATIGEQSNIGAATVFVNYDGVHKHRSTVGDHVKIGSDTMIVAPRTVGDGAYTAAGSVLTADVPPGAMAVGRARQRNVEIWVLRSRAGTPAADAAARAIAEQPLAEQPPQPEGDA